MSVFVKAHAFVFAGVISLWGASPAPSLQLVKRIPLSEIVNDQGKALKAEELVHATGPSFGSRGNQVYGFIKGGKAFTPGWGGWVLDIGTGSWKQEYPANLHDVSITMDGGILNGIIKNSAGNTNSFWKDTLPDDSDVSPEDDPHYFQTDCGNSISGNSGWIVKLSVDGTNVPLKGRYLSHVNDFTADGRYLIVDDFKLVDTRTKRLLPIDPTMDKDLLGKRPDTYIGDSAAFVFNRDASLVAGRYTEMGYLGSCFVWDRIHKSRIWMEPESESYGTPSSFSPNDKYLLCEGIIVDAQQGTPVIKGLKGKKGKFSPDGRSVVTVDDEAFYIYTLPKESEPIFGVFQKPEPWSPPKAKTPAKARGKTKKP